MSKSKGNMRIKTITICMGEKDIELTMDEARELRDRLNELSKDPFCPSEPYWSPPYYHRWRSKKYNSNGQAQAGTV